MLKSTGAVRICRSQHKRFVHENNGWSTVHKLDLSHAYQHVVLDGKSLKLTTINTSKGLFEYERLPYGVSSPPGIFQRVMEQLFLNIPMTVVYLDDVLVAGRTSEEHDRNLHVVLSGLQEAGLHMKKENSTPSDKFLSTENAPAPQPAQELRRSWGSSTTITPFCET